NKGKNVSANRIETTVLVDRYGYTWTGWFTRGYETGRDIKVATDNTTEYYLGSMQATSVRLIVGHDSSLRTYSSNYQTTFDNTNLSDTAKFDVDVYDSLQSKIPLATAKTSGVFEFTLYAGWEANTYTIYYESNDVRSTSTLKGKSVIQSNGALTELGYLGTVAGGTSYAYKLGGYAQTLVFDCGVNSEATAFQRVGYTFEGYSLGQDYIYYKTTDESKAQSTKVRLDYFAIKQTGIGTSAKTTDSYLYYKYDLNGYGDATKQTYEVLGDDQREFAVVLHAFYRANVYKVSFNSNKTYNSIGGSTNPYFMGLSNSKYDDVTSDHEKTVYIEFDTNNWLAADGTTLSDILVDRFGYTWMGWYTRRTGYNSVWTDFFKYIAEAGNADDGRTERILNYTMFTTYFDATVEGANSTDEHVNGNVQIASIATTVNAPSAISRAANNGFVISGDWIEEYDTNYKAPNDKHIITLSAAWQANTYTLTYYFSDVNSIKNSNNNGSWETTSPIESLSNGSRVVATGSVVNDLPGLQTPTVFDSTIFTMTLLFDKESATPEYLTRIGYMFKGWRFGLKSTYTIAEDNKIILNADTIKIDGVENTSEFENSYLYINTIYNDTTFAQDAVNYYNLGNFETLGDNTDVAYEFTVGAGNAVSFTRTTTLNYAQIFAIWDVNTYVVEFNVNRNFEKAAES
ncbi:MAG: hypothetical protein IJA23_01765, partial [Clostridia bacterium]|nr:hypothetical protein [Clostridia bacterium]